jgi:hypothetical protein
VLTLLVSGDKEVTLMVSGDKELTLTVSGNKELILRSCVDTEGVRGQRVDVAVVC